MSSTRDVTESNSTPPLYSDAEIQAMTYAFDQVQMAQIFIAVWIGALALDMLYYIVFDFELLFFTSGWRVPARLVTRVSYMLSRISGTLALSLCLLFLSQEWSEKQCHILPLVFQSLLLLSYICTLLILCFRTLALYSSNSRLDRGVQWGLGLGLVNIATWTLVHLKDARGVRAQWTRSRCHYHETAQGPLLVKGLLASTVLLNLAMFSLTFYKMYLSGTHNFFNGRTCVTSWIGGKQRSQKPEGRLSANHLASSLIAQGLYAFFALLLVDIAALMSAFLLASTYQLMSIISLGAFSSVLGSMVFRETMRASESIAALAKVEADLREAQAQVEKASEKRISTHQHQNSSNEKICRSHYRFNPDLDTGLQSCPPSERPDSYLSHSFSSLSLDSKNFHERPVTMISVFEDDSRPPSRDGLEDVARARLNQTSLGMLSLHAFDGAPNATKDGVNETLGQVSILGSSWAQNASKRASRGFRKADMREQASNAFRTKEVSSEATQTAADHSLPPPVRRKRKEGHVDYISRIHSGVSVSSRESLLVFPLLPLLPRASTP